MRFRSTVVVPCCHCRAYNTCCNQTVLPHTRLPDCWVPNPNCNDVTAFRTDIANWLQRSLQPLGGALIALAVLLFLTIVGSCFVSKIGKKQMLERIQELAHIPNVSIPGLRPGAAKAAAPYANMA